ncbi:ADAM 17-like protease isoform X1 [Varroa jacobsoni]|uniref:ADAM 17-like protease isoform X1 n=1 Tax=Varroa jacobsoni TaxID=62625 RepID=UPI000BF447DD|nr:ADAM 17-like protease isoform X1 [Varroa jacobsoni]
MMQVILIDGIPFWLLLIAIQKSESNSNDEPEFELASFGPVRAKQTEPIFGEPFAEQLPRKFSNRRPFEFDTQFENYADSTGLSFENPHESRYFRTSNISHQDYEVSAAQPRRQSFSRTTICRKDIKNREQNLKPAALSPRSQRVEFRPNPLKNLCNKPPPPVPPVKATDFKVQKIKPNMSCPLHLVADTSFVEHLTHEARHLDRRVGAVVVEIMTVLYYVNVIFKQMIFNTHGAAPSGLRFTVGEIKVHSGYFDRGYNVEGKFDSISELFWRFAVGEGNTNSRHCGAVLFTGKDFSPCLDLGLAYIGSADKLDAGICAQPRPTRDDTSIFVTPNIAVVTARQRTKPIARMELVRALAHELGHMWGAHHDSVKDSKYIMYNRKTKNRVMEFSDVSIDQMSRILNLKVSCFSSKINTCGNEKLDPGEACDEGWAGGPCCDSNCALKRFADCSDLNDRCCVMCKFAPKDTFCRRPDYWDCLDGARCTGNNATCPDQAPAKNGTACRNFGVCMAGRCIHICEKLNLKPCRSENGRSCEIRCNDSRRCKSFDPPIHYENGTLCGNNGICHNRLCKPYCEYFGLRSCKCPEAYTRRKICCESLGICAPMINTPRRNYV